MQVALSALPGVEPEDVLFDFEAKTATFTVEGAAPSKAVMADALESAGFGLEN